MYRYFIIISLSVYIDFWFWIVVFVINAIFSHFPPKQFPRTEMYGIFPVLKKKKKCWGENSTDVYLVFTFSFAYFFFMIFFICAHKIVRDQTKIWKCPINPRSLQEEEEKKNIASESGSGTIVTLADLFDFWSKN